MWPIKNVKCEEIGDETLISFEFHQSWFFERLKFDNQDYVMYVSNESFIPRRMWLKTIMPELRDKKMIFNDIEYENNFTRIYFREVR
jgi:hypothetical protein